MNVFYMKKNEDNSPLAGIEKDCYRKKRTHKCPFFLSRLERGASR